MRELHKGIICGLVVEPILPASCRRTGYWQSHGEDIGRLLEMRDQATAGDGWFIGEEVGTNADGYESVVTLV